MTASLSSFQILGLNSKNIQFMIEVYKKSLQSSDFALPDLDDIPVRVTNVTANLETMVLWLGQEFGSSTSPLLVT